MAEFPFLEVNEAIRLYGGEDLNACMQCGLCASVCPWREVESPFFARQMIRMGQLGLEGYESRRGALRLHHLQQVRDQLPPGGGHHRHHAGYALHGQRGGH